MIENLNTIDNRTMMKRVGLIAGPIALQSLIASSLNLIDNLMIGGLGELALNAVGVSMQCFFVFWMLVFGFSSGNATFSAGDSSFATHSRYAARRRIKSESSARSASQRSLLNAMHPSAAMAPIVDNKRFTKTVALLDGKSIA